MDNHLVGDTVVVAVADSRDNGNVAAVVADNHLDIDPVVAVDPVVAGVVVEPVDLEIPVVAVVVVVLELVEEHLEQEDHY